MNLKYNNFKQIIATIIVINLAGIAFLLIFIGCYLETKSSENLYGLFFLLFFVLMDALFFSIRKYMFSKVIIEDGKIKENYFKKTLKEINLIDIKLLYVDADNLCVSPIESQIEFINQFSPIVRNKKTITFRMNLTRFNEIFEPIKLDFCYISNRVPKEIQEKIISYMNIKELQWEKKKK